MMKVGRHVACTYVVMLNSVMRAVGCSEVALAK